MRATSSTTTRSNGTSIRFECGAGAVHRGAHIGDESHEARAQPGMQFVPALPKGRRRRVLAIQPADLLHPVKRRLSSLGDVCKFVAEHSGKAQHAIALALQGHAQRANPCGASASRSLICATMKSNSARRSSRGLNHAPVCESSSKKVSASVAGTGRRVRCTFARKEARCPA